MPLPKARNAETAFLPQNLKIIGESAFAGCSLLERIEIPQNVNEIGYGAFANCTELAEVIMPEIIEKMQFFLFE